MRFARGRPHTRLSPCFLGENGGACPLLYRSLMSNSKGNFWVKCIAMLVGLPLTLLALMTLASMLTSNVWIQLGIAFAVAVVLPLLVADRLLPAEVEKGRGIPSTVLTISWVAIPVLVFGLCLGVVSPMLHAEAAILDNSPVAMAAPVARFIAIGDADTDDADTDDAVATVDRGGSELEPRAEQALSPSSTPSPSPAPAPPSAQTSAPVRPVPAANPPSPTGLSGLFGSGTESMTPSAVFRVWADSVVSVKIFHGDTALGNGTGFAVGRDRVVTNHHVVEMVIGPRGEVSNGVRVGVQTRDGSWAQDVRLLDYDVERDLALLHVDLPGDTPPVRLAQDESIEVGEPVISIGSPYGLDHTVTDGIVSARRMLEGSRWLQVSSPISPGNSGGPIFDGSGAVVGVSTRVVTTESRAQNLNLAIPSGDVMTFIERTPTIDHPIDIGGGQAQATGSW